MSTPTVGGYLPSRRYAGDACTPGPADRRRRHRHGTTIGRAVAAIMATSLNSNSQSAENAPPNGANPPPDSAACGDTVAEADRGGSRPAPPPHRTRRSVRKLATVFEIRRDGISLSVHVDRFEIRASLFPLLDRPGPECARRPALRLRRASGVKVRMRRSPRRSVRDADHVLHAFDYVVVGQQLRIRRPRDDNIGH